MDNSSAEPKPGRNSTSANHKRVLIAGAGTAGRSLAEDVVEAGDVVVGYLDDTLTGDDILGTLADVAFVCEARAVQMVYLAIPSADAAVVREFVTRVPRPAVEIAIVPRTYRVVSRERVSVDDLTDIDVLDLVGRAPIKHDMMHARDIIADRRILVTGAAGSIGSRLVAQLQALGPEVVVCADRSESAMFRLGHEFHEASEVRLEIADVQSTPRMSQLMERYRPEYVFHVAAYKHVPLMQHSPVEAFNNNVWGTLNVFEQAAAAGAERVIYVSTDKAVNPTNVMGATKRIGELLMRDLGSQTETIFSAVRFGNVLESEGSVMQIFRRQLARQVNLTVTHPEITRYFMTIDEAAQLVIQSAIAGRGSDLFVLDMGEPIRVVDLAQGLIDAVNPRLKVDIIGLRPGEKMYEELSYRASMVDRTSHPKIMVVTEDDEHEEGDTIAWARETLRRTLSYSISDGELKDALRSFGFARLQ